MAFNFSRRSMRSRNLLRWIPISRTWANAQGWKLSDEEQSVDISVDYDFDDENISEGIYQITFSTTGREFKIHTTDYVEEGKEVGLTFFPQDIHVMEKMEF